MLPFKIKQLTKKERVFVELFVGAARNSELENLHAGITPSSKTGDFTDVKVVTPFGEIPWNKLSRISDAEMGPLKDSFRNEMTYMLSILKSNGLSIIIEKGSIAEKFLK